MDSMSFNYGKYTVISDNGKLTALRYGEKWQDLCGNNLVYWMLMDAMTLKKERNDLYDALSLVLSWIDNWNPNFEEDGEWKEARDKINKMMKSVVENNE